MPCILFFMMIPVFPVHDCYADDDTFMPWEFNQSVNVKHVSIQNNMAIDPSLKSSSLIDIIRIVYHSVSSVDGDRCQMAPTCSVYSIQAIEKHGFFIGFMMTADRLIHESDESDLALVIRSENKSRAFDPVSHNDFWWYKSRNLDK